MPDSLRDMEPVLQTMPGAVLVLRREKVIWANRDAAELFGREPAVMTGLELASLFPDQKFVGLCVERAAAGVPGCRETAQGRAGTSQEEGVWTRVWAGRLPTGSDPLVVLSVQDISARRELDRVRYEYESLLRESLDHIIIYDLQGKARYVNPAWERTFGWTREEVVGGLIDYVPPEEREQTLAHIRRLVDDGVGTVGFETRRKTKDGRFRDISISAYRYFDMDGRTAGIVVIQHDITEQKRLLDQVHQGQKMEALGTLAGGVAHEFNNILMAMQANMGMLRHRQEQGQEIDEHLDQLEGCCRRASALTRRMLAFARKQEQETRALDLNRLLPEAVQLLSRTIGPGIDIITELADDLPPVLGDPIQVEQVLLNLGLNARDAMPEGGRLTYRASLREADYAFCLEHPWAEDGRRYLELVVRDSGCGMSAEVAERAMEPFFTTKEPGKGTGLGLSVVYNLVTGMGGRVLVHSVPGRGSSFTIFLPALETEPQPEPVASAKSERRVGQGQRILVVDDEDEIRRITSAALEDAGFQVVQARHGGEAVDLFGQALEQGRRIELVILDLAMPVMNGRLCMPRLLELDPSCRIIISTGYLEESHSWGDLSQKAASVLLKPYDLGTLVSTVSKALTGA